LLPEAGQVVRVGPLRLDVLWPRRGDPPPADPNEGAIVARLSEGSFDVLLAADAESHVTLPLRPPPSEVLKVAHHGSADPALPALLERVRPRLAVVSAGAGNPYGHPAPPTLEALRAVPHVARTDQDGTVRVSVADGRMAVRRHG
jgi:competence protein ComEC